MKKNRLCETVLLAGETGIEPATYGFGDRRSAN